VRSAYKAEVSETRFCLVGGTTHTIKIEYSLIPSSNKLWVPTALDPELAAFASNQLEWTAFVDAAVQIDAPGSQEVAFDRDGNLWTVGPSEADPTLIRYAAADLGKSGDREPDFAIDVPELSCYPAVHALALDSEGDLWLSACGEQLIELGASQLAETGEMTAQVSLSGLSGNAGIAFDGTGNLWVADAGKVVRFDAQQLKVSGSVSPQRSLSVRDASNTYDLHAERLAFDQQGDLWATDSTSNFIFEVPAAMLTGTGEEAVTAYASIALDSMITIDGIAFDGTGALWLGLTNGTLGKLSPEQLTLSTLPEAPTAPQLTLQTTSVGDAGSLAFFPAPAGLPLYHALP
jgi:ligand-binding sensor domain-containing protein